MYRPDPMVNNYLVSLDMLFDTRLGTVAKLGADALDTLEKVDYDNREDDSCLHDIPGYTEAWANRDIETLKLSTKSKFLDTMVEILRDDIHDTIVSMPDRKFHLYLNTYPYTLPPEVKEEYCYILNLLLGGKVKVQTRHLSPQMLSPNNMRNSGYTAVMMYDFIDWIKLHFEALYDTPLQELVMVVPSLKEIGIVAPEIPEEFSELSKRYSGWDAVEISLMEVLAVKHYPITDFTGYLYKLAKKEA